ncbi:hypothetical protein [Streptomyces sp. NPDC002553]|uniref:hypothetical protein n=1 Tax=Streptomyces sp. NPDC002553 TaxID=3154417 RepID=UPI00332E78F6
MDTTSDAVDADPSDGRCRTASGTCTLRAAVMAANARPAVRPRCLPATTGSRSRPARD